ncbi:unnamed protein product [Fusarium venenatum]|uniref:Uncharacterized protein n=1 Tax=Fusarium venenatum TaxID=56646 RepID=A0A2L2T7F8_9HYPO|nr:uncharacterized protein FVRRES_04523 [Fusarium venenatum]CEI60087.1 unnamed protein product [Fusarium venenatum]
METSASGLDVKAVAFGANVDEEVTRIWKDVEGRVVQMAGGDPAKIKQGLGINDVLQYLNEDQVKDKQVSEKYGTVKNIFNRTLQCIQTVGGIVADGASYVFAPAGQCYNALTFVIQAWQGYEGIFESLAGLLEKCIEFLDRLEYYAKPGMDSKLTRVACQHLQIFVKICDRSLRLRSKRSKFAAFMKQMFLNDDGMQGLLSEMQNLVDKEHSLVSAQTWKSSNEAATNSRDGLLLTRNLHSSLVDDRNKKQHDTDRLKWKQTIVNALELNPSILKPDSQAPWDKAWKRHKENRFEGSGEWLIQDPRFVSWVSGDQDSKQILAFQGDEGAGKTLLAANVLLHLRKMRGSGPKVIIAHNFLDKDSKSSTIQDDALDISRHVMGQIALSHDPIMKSVAGICDKVRDFSSPLEILTALLLDNQDLLAMDSNMYIVLDGLGDNAEVLIKFLQNFSENPLIQRTRILLTGKKQLFETINKAGGVKMERIVLGETNSKDLEIYIKKRMDGMEILKDISRPSVSDLRAKILQDLQSSTEGDYYKIGRVLDNIATATEAEEINSLLESAGDMRPDQIESDIEKLNQNCNAKEIAEINEIILWVNTGKMWFNPLSMEAALALKAGPGGSTSLMSIEAKIASKYSIFSTESGFVEYKVDNVEDMVPLKKRDVTDDGSSSGFKEIQPAEVNIIKHYLSTVCPSDLYKKFGFDQFFECKMTRKSNYVCRDPDNAEATMVLRCITCLSDERTSKTERLHSYTTEYLQKHLEEADLSLTDRSIKAETGKALVRLFTEQYALDSLFGFHLFIEDTSEVSFSANGVPDTWNTWIFSDEGVNSIAKWFKDSAVKELVKDNELIISFEIASNRHLALFGAAATTAAQDLFMRDTSRRETVRAYILLSALLNKVYKEPADDEKTGESENVKNEEKKGAISEDIDPIYKPTLEDFQRVEKWASERLNVTDKDSKWEAKASLLLSYIRGETIPKTLVEHRARKALWMEPESWVATYALSRVTESRDESLLSLQKVFNTLTGDIEWQKERGHKGILARIIYDLGDKYWTDEKQREQAITTYSMIFTLGRSIELFASFKDVLQKYAEAERWDVMAEFFDRLLDEPEDGPNLAGDFTLYEFYNYDFHTTFVKMVRALDRFDLLDNLFARAIAKATTKTELEGRGWDDTLRFRYGETLFEIPGHEEAGIHVWELLLKDAPDETREWVTRAMVKCTVPAWLELAIASKDDPARAQGFFDKIEAQYKELQALGTRDQESTIVFAQYFKCRGDVAKAKQILKPYVTEQLEMLSDNRTDNDQPSLWILGQILSVMRDYVNIGVCMDMMRYTNVVVAREEYEADLTRYHEEQKQKKLAETKGESFKGTFESEPQEPDSRIVCCDGCEVSWEFASEVWTCMSCSGAIQFCVDCYNKLQLGNLNNRVCKKEHEHYFLPKRNVEEIDALPKGSVKVGERTITFEEWKDEIRGQYVNLVSLSD